MRQIHTVILKFFKREQSDAIYSQVLNYEKKPWFMPATLRR